MEVMNKHIVTQFGFADNQFNDNDHQLRYANSDSDENTI